MASPAEVTASAGRSLVIAPSCGTAEAVSFLRRGWRHVACLLHRLARDWPPQAGPLRRTAPDITQVRSSYENSPYSHSFSALRARAIP